MVCGTLSGPLCRGKAKYLNTGEKHEKGFKVNKIYVCDTCGSSFRFGKGVNYVEVLEDK